MSISSNFLWRHGVHAVFAVPVSMAKKVEAAEVEAEADTEQLVSAMKTVSVFFCLTNIVGNAAYMMEVA